MVEFFRKIYTSKLTKDDLEYMKDYIWTQSMKEYTKESKQLEKLEDGVKEYFELNVKYGLTNEIGKPIRCYCGSKDFEDFDIYGSEWGTEEYNVRCICCGKTVGHWCYGNWQL